MTIKIASYNLWNGAQDTYFRLIDFIKDQNFDVLCLQEVNDWQHDDQRRLKEFADRADFDSFDFGNSNSEFKMVTFSKLPVTFREVFVEGFWHSAIEIHVKAGDLEFSVVNIHLDPYKEEPRMHEISRLFEMIDLKKPTIITGDFNSISRKDNYPPEFLAELQKRKFYKFGQNELTFEVTDFLESSGFDDVAAWLGNKDTTVPTPFGEKVAEDEIAASEAPARIDYFFASQELLPLIKNYEVLKNHFTDKLSDHYPIVLTMEIPEKAEEPEKSQKAETPKEEPELPQPIETEDGVEIKLH